MDLAEVLGACPEYTVHLFFSAFECQSLDEHLAFFLDTAPAITKRGFVWILLIGATNGPIKITTTGTFASKNDLRILHMVLKKKDFSVRL